MAVIWNENDFWGFDNIKTRYLPKLDWENQTNYTTVFFYLEKIELSNTEDINETINHHAVLPWKMKLTKKGRVKVNKTSLIVFVTVLFF